MAVFLSRVTLAFALMLAAFPAHAQTDANTKPIETVFADYVAGLAEGDLTRLSRAFSAEGVFITVTAAKGEKPATIISRPFKDVLASWAANPDPTASGRITRVTVQNDNMASIEAELDFGADQYEDSLLLYKVEGRWVIVAKTTYARDRPDHSAPKTSKD